MKKHLLLLLFLPFISFSQEKGSYAIVVTNNNEEQSNYVDLLKTFMSEGFKIDEKDDLFHTVTFEPVKYNFGYGKRTDTHWNYLIVDAVVSGDSITVRMKNKRSGKLKRETVYDPQFPETVAAFDRVIGIVKSLGDLTFPKYDDYDEKKKRYRDDVYGQ